MQTGGAMADKSKVGKEYTPIHWEVERGKIREFIRAIGDNNPVYTDKEAAVNEGYRDTPVPPTFITVPMMFSNSMVGMINDLGINIFRILHGEEEYEYYRPVYPGDILTGIPKIASIEEKTNKAGKKMDLITFDILYTNQQREPVVRERFLLIERK
jgi:acyl dehydratase